MKVFISKLNFFDYLVFFLLFLVLLFFIYNRLQRRVVWTNVRIAVENVDWWYGSGAPPRYWYANDLAVGDQAKDSFGQTVAEVVNIDNYDQGGPYRMIFVDLKLRVDFDKNKNQYLYEFKPLSVGSSLIINFPQHQLRGIIVQTGADEIDYFFKTIKITKQRISNFVADEADVGDKVYDAQGNLVAEILDFTKSTNSYYEYSDIRGQKIKVTDPDYSDLDIVLKVKAFNTLDRDFYINNTVLKVGSKIWLQFKDYAIEDAQIIEIMD
ncbi:MAG TPA: hypothetical protein PL154_02910 [Candidatus Woesebacteria bacterium]|nr:hypothetical protein [Candidatus Woesebacteria bacterium]HPK08296.1 hypothetical protein [Candidatus Woesebacteria bacterium]